MDRRQFLKESTLALGLAQSAAAQRSTRKWVIENEHIAWHVEQTADRIRSAAFENRISGSRLALETGAEFTLVFSQGQRIEIPWWISQYTDPGSIPPEGERGMREGFHQPGNTRGNWSPVANLAGGRRGRVYDGYAWFRSDFSLPSSARGKEIVFVLGGYDRQDWNERWIYVNGHDVGHAETSGAWRTPGYYVLRPQDPAYAALRFESGAPNLLAVRARAYDYRAPGISDEILNRQVFRPFLFDQFISIGAPFKSLSQFKLADARQESREHLRFTLQDAESRCTVDAHYEIKGPVRSKWLELRNDSKAPALLLDVELERFKTGVQATEGGHGDPVLLADEAFFMLDHPAGVNQYSDGTVRLWHSPGTQIAPGASMKTAASLAGVASQGTVLDSFRSYITSRSPRVKKKRISLFTCYGINNQWGGCPALTTAEVLDCERVVRSWQSKGVKFDFFTLDQGWPDNAGDLTQFAPACYPDGPQPIFDGIHEMQMKSGLWFSVSGGGWSDGSYAPVQPSAIPAAGTSGEPPSTPPVPSYRNGYPATAGIGRTLCVSSDPYFNVLNNAIQHHVQVNGLRLVKLDIGDYYCNSTHHQHLPGRYSTEAMFNRLIEIARNARAIAPDVFIIWYWGPGASPAWALYGDAIFESGLFMEGSGTSWYPSLYYRDSVTLSLDQSTRFARFVPPLLKDSLGVWLSQIRWANFMGKSRWRESLVMDLGRGNLMFPQIWGDPNLLNDDDLSFLSGIMAFARENESILLSPRRDVGDAMKNEPYAYFFSNGTRGLAFCHNMHFEARKINLPVKPGSRLTTYFPEKQELIADKSGTTFWMRPFETLLIQINAPASTRLPRRELIDADAAAYGTALTLDRAEPAPWMDLTFADRERFEKAAMQPSIKYFSTRLPALSAGHFVLALHVKLKRGSEEYRYKPVVTEIVQLRARLGEHEIQLFPVPDARQYGNTQNAGCSWVVYKVPISAAHSGQLFQFAVHSYLPANVEALTEGWLVKQWWQDSTRPEADGFYGQAPS